MGLLFVAATGVACGAPSRARDDRPPPRAEPSPAQARLDPAERVLTIGTRTPPRGLDPLAELDPWGDRIARDLLFQGLVRRSSRGAPWVEMALADRCIADRPARPRSVSCHLPPGRHFSDDTEVEVEDVLYSGRYWLDPRRAVLLEQAGLGDLRAVDPVDAPPGQPELRDKGRWIRFDFAGADPLALEKIAEIPIVPRAKHRDPAAFARAPIGSGPMELESFEAGKLVLRARELEGEGLAKLIVRGYPDGADALTALRRGDIQILDELAPAHLPEELAQPGMAARFRAWLRAPASYTFLLFNSRPPGLEVDSGLRQALREALADAIPRAAIDRGIFGTPGWPTQAPVDRYAPRELDLGAIGGTDHELDLAAAGLLAFEDPGVDGEAAARARDRLEALGWVIERGVRGKAGTHLRITMTWDGSPGQARALAEAVQAAWEQLGIQTPEAISSFAYLRTLLRRGEFESALLHLGSHEDADLFDYFHSSGLENWAGLRDRELDAALEAYRVAETREARDQAKEEVARRIEAAGVLAMLRAPAPVLLASRRVGDLEFEDDLPRLDRIRMAPRGSEEVWDRR